MRSQLATALIFGALLVGCAPAEDTAERAEEGRMQAAAGEQAAVQAIEAVRQQEVAAAEAADLEGFLSAFTEDAVAMPPGDASVSGQTALRAWLSDFWQSYRIENLEYSGLELTLIGDWAFEPYDFSWTIVPVGEGEPMPQSGKGVHIYHRGPDGSWKIALDIWNQNAPPAGATEMADE